MGKKKSKDDDGLDDLLAANTPATGFVGFLLSIWAAILAIFLGAPKPAKIAAKPKKEKKAPAPAPAPAPTEAKKPKAKKAKKAKKEEAKKPKDEMPVLAGSTSSWADDDDGWATAGSKPVASKKKGKAAAAEPADEEWATAGKKTKKKESSAPAPAPAPTEDEWATTGSKKSSKSKSKEADIEPSGSVTLNKKANKVKKRLVTFYEKHNKSKAKEFKSGKHDDLVAHFCKPGNSLEMLNEKLLELYGQDLEAIA